MQLTLTLCRPVAGRHEHCAVDLTVEVEPGTPLRAVSDELTRAAGRPGSTLYAGSRPLPGHAVLGEGPLQHGAVLGVGTAGPHRAARAGILELRVVGGPDAGGVYALTQGTVLLGRDLAATVSLADPDLSRRHAQLLVGPDGVTVRDLGSTNGTRLDGRPVGGEAEPLRPGALLRIGESTLVVATADDPPAAVRTDRSGRALLNRPPRLLPDQPEVTITLPPKPAARTPSKLPVLSALLPLVGGVGMAVLWHAPQYLLFTVLSPVLLIANAFGERRGLKKGRRRELAEYRTALAEAESRVIDGLAAEQQRRRAAAPDLARLWRTATGPGQLLWERRRSDPDALQLRIGLATLPAELTVEGANDRPTVADVPATIGLAELGVLGVAGPAGPTRALLRSLLIQLATLHGPHDLSVTLLCDDGQARPWAWCRWLPHLDGGGVLRVGLTAPQRAERIGELLRELDARQQDGGPLRRQGWDPAAAPFLVVVLDQAAALREVPGVARLLAEGPECGIFSVCVDAARRLLPAECGAVVEVSGEAGTRARVVLPGRPAVSDVRVDGAGPAVAEEISRALAPLRGDLTEASGEPPASARLLPLLALRRPAPQPIRDGWRGGGRTTTTVIGESAGGPQVIDLARDGPHALVAGTTGSGKSELLQTIIAGLAIANRPDAMTFVLIDYKGGAAFKDCVHLPHTVGMVTDLDAHLTERALISLTAELKYREQILAAAGAKDIEDYWRTGAGSLPRLVLVIDEFASLVEELPDFVTGLVGIAMRGRSLGVHLILATQRPSGVVSPVIRANTNLRIALRVTDDGESRDVIDTDQAARIGKEVPGRAYLRIGSEPPVPFQTARVGGRSVAEDAPGSPVTVSPWLEQGSRPPVRTDEDGQEQTDLQQVVRAVAEAARMEGQSAPRRPWLPALPEQVRLSDLPPAEGDTVPFALADHPHEQRRDVIGIDLAGGDSLAVVGGPRSGRSGVLRAIAASAAGRYGPEDLHLYVLDCAGGAQAATGELPHCGAVCERQDVVRGDRVLARLADEVTRRQELLAAGGFASAAEQRAAVASGDRLPWLLVLVDGWEGFTAAYEAVDHGRPVDTLLTLAREGAAVGLRVVITGGRPLLTGRVDAVLPARIVLRMGDPNDYSMAGLPRKSVPDQMPDGRGILIDGATELQIAQLEGADQIGAMHRLAASARAAAAGADPALLPFQVRPLPHRISIGDLQPPRRRGPLWTAIGVAGDTAATVGVDLAADGPGFLIAGPSRSGRSTALQTMAIGLLAAGTRIALLGPRRSPLRELARRGGVIGCFEPDDGEILAAATSGPCAVLVDEIPACTDTSAGDVLTAMLQADDGRRAVIGAGRADDLAMVFRGPALAVRAARSGLLLSPGAPDGELLGTRLPRVSGRQPPGRGVLIVGGEQTAVQVALPDLPEPGRRIGLAALAAS